MKKRLKNGFLIGCIITTALFSTSCGQAETATTIRLEQTEGIVNVFANAKEKGLTVLEKMKLYAGYFVETEEDSSAHISLDEAKAIKMDESSMIEIEEQGGNLLLNLEEGNLFFRVDEPLSENESFSIKTSNAIMGIRGTSGYILNKDDDRSAVYLLSGKAEITATSPVTGKEKTVEIESGERLTIYRNASAKNEEQLRFIKKEFDEKNLPSFVREILREDDAFREEIQKVTHFNYDNWDDDDWDDDWDDDDDDDWDDDWDDDDDDGWDDDWDDDDDDNWDNDWDDDDDDDWDDDWDDDDDDDWDDDWDDDDDDNDD